MGDDLVGLHKGSLPWHFFESGSCLVRGRKGGREEEMKGKKERVKEGGREGRRKGGREGGRE